LARVDPIQPVPRTDRRVPPVDLARLKALEREKQRRERERKRPQRPGDPPGKRPGNGGDGIDVRA